VRADPATAWRCKKLIDDYVLPFDEGVALEQVRSTAANRASTMSRRGRERTS